MSPPRVCPPPPDCSLYNQRVPHAQDEPLRRAVLMEKRKPRNLADLVWADFTRQHQRPAPPRPDAPTPTVPELPRPALPLTESLHQKGVMK